MVDDDVKPVAEHLVASPGRAVIVETRVKVAAAIDLAGYGSARRLHGLALVRLAAIGHDVLISLGIGFRIGFSGDSIFIIRNLEDVQDPGERIAATGGSGRSNAGACQQHQGSGSRSNLV